MAADSDPPPRPSDEQSAELPRRVPGAGGLTPAQVRRGYLPATRIPGTSGTTAARAGTSGTTAARAGHPARETGPAAPATFAASAARLVAAMAPDSDREEHVTATAPAVPAITSRNEQPRHPGRRWRLAGVLIAVILVTAVVATAELAGRNQATGARRATTSGSRSIAAETAARGDAVGWITSQVGTDIVIACDPVVCSDLAQHRFPAGNLNVLQPTAPDPYGSGLVVATADVRSQFGSKLERVYAPEVIASFGTGTNRIDIRVIAQQGPSAFRAALTADLTARRSSGAQLLGNGRVTAAPGARVELAAGLVDVRLLTTIAFLAGQQPVDIAGFSTSAPGAGPALLLRFAYLAATGTAAHLTGAAYVHALIGLMRSQSPPYVPLRIGMVRLPDGQQVLRVEFAAPSPIGLLKS